jgi:hypothetical protein
MKRVDLFSGYHSIAFFLWAGNGSERRELQAAIQQVFAIQIRFLI